MCPYMSLEANLEQTPKNSAISQWEAMFGG